MITDGLSNTVFASERAMGFINANRVYPLGEWTDSSGASTLVFAWNSPNSVFPDWSRPNYQASVMPGILVSSRHPRGANVLLGDGSVRFVKETISSWPIDPNTMSPVGIIYWFDGFKNVPPGGNWQALATRSGGELFASDY
jgi:prepilin-type processing-associated H-X9-DG protein